MYHGKSEGCTRTAFACPSSIIIHSSVNCPMPDITKPSSTYPSLCMISSPTVRSITSFPQESSQPCKAIEIILYFIGILNRGGISSLRHSYHLGFEE